MKGPPVVVLKGVVQTGGQGIISVSLGSALIKENAESSGGERERQGRDLRGGLSAEKRGGSATSSPPSPSRPREEEDNGGEPGVAAPRALSVDGSGRAPDCEARRMRWAAARRVVGAASGELGK